MENIVFKCFLIFNLIYYLFYEFCYRIFIGDIVLLFFKVVLGEVYKCILKLIYIKIVMID